MLSTKDGILDKRSFIRFTVASLQSVFCCRSDEHKSSVLHRVCSEDLVMHEVFLTSVQIVLPWSLTSVTTRTLHRSVWSLRECRVPSSVSWIVFKCFASGDDLLCNQWVRKEAFCTSLHRSQKLKAGHLTVLLLRSSDWVWRTIHSFLQIPLI